MTDHARPESFARALARTEPATGPELLAVTTTAPATARWGARHASKKHPGTVWWLTHDGLEMGSFSVLHPLLTPELTMGRVVDALNRDGAA